MPAKVRAGFDVDALSVARVEATAVHASVTLSGPQPGGTPRFASEKLTQLYGEMSSYGFESFSFLPNGAQMSTLPAKQAVITLDRTLVVEELAISGSTVRPFSELVAILLDKVQSVLDVKGFRQVQCKLVAFWPVPDKDALKFVTRATRMRPTVLSSLGPGYDLAGVRFHKGKPGQAEECNVRVEPVLRQPDRLWIEVEPVHIKPFAKGSAVAELLLETERFLREQVVSAVLAMAGDKK